jgi:hypothetical protein
MPVVIERFKEIPFEFKSKIRDIGNYRRVFKIHRVTPGLQTEISRVKSSLMGGEIPVKNTDAFHLEMVAYISVLCEPIWSKQEVKDDNWLDNEFLNDVTMLRALYDKIVGYNNSFYVEDVSDETTSQAE